MKKILCLLVLGSMLAFATSVYAQNEVKVDPYGFVLVNANYNDAIAADIPVKAALGDTLDKGNFLITPRQTRFGLNMSYATDWTISGKIELDFWGLKGSGANGGVMQSAPRLRLAYFQIQRENITLLFGQQWSFFAPLSPTSIAHVSIPEFSSCGNLWNRFPQLRFEYKAMAGEGNTMLFQFALIRPLGADVSPARTQGDELGAGEFSQMPFLQGRLSFAANKTAAVGFSVHFGQEDFHKADDSGIRDKKTTTMAVAGDVKFIADMVTFSAEGFWGENLRMLFSNAHLRSEYNSSNDTYTIKGVEAVGGWGQVSISPPDYNVTFNLGAGMEALKEEHVDSLVGNDDYFNPKHNPQLLKNMTFFGNIMVKPVKRVTIAFEFNHIKTTYKAMEEETKNAMKIAEKDADDNSVNVGFKFDF